ncbi:MAG: hypothetical protein IV100_24820 [Myxococcales bacterium]|nr:hypothetical protein [Myxococcales bacterium]
MPADSPAQLDGNPLPEEIELGDDIDEGTDSRSKLPEIFAATTVLDMIREPAFVILVALQDLFIPALQLVEILDAAFPNSIPMYKKWELVTAVKHFHQRRGLER